MGNFGEIVFSLLNFGEIACSHARRPGSRGVPLRSRAYERRYQAIPQELHQASRQFPPALRPAMPGIHEYSPCVRFRPDPCESVSA